MSDECCTRKQPCTNEGGTISKAERSEWSTTRRLTLANYWDHFLARCGINRDTRRVKPGLYSLDHPTRDSHVFVTANYRLSFDALRSALPEISAHLLVLDTKGINVWCAAGKGTFGTDELLNRIEATGLGNLVRHRQLILPQLGAAGVSAHEIKKRSGFEVEYGPVRARDLPEYLKTHKATLEMRRVRFNLADRLILIPVELLQVLAPALVIAAVLLALGKPMASLGAIVSIMAGVVLFPALLPWLPTPNFATKGFILGALVAIPFARAVLVRGVEIGPLIRVGWAGAYILAMSAVTSFVSLNFTGSTPFTSRTGVRREIFTYVPVMAWMLGMAIALAIALSFLA